MKYLLSLSIIMLLFSCSRKSSTSITKSEYSPNIITSICSCENSSRQTIDDFIGLQSKSNNIEEKSNVSIEQPWFNSNFLSDDVYLKNLTKVRKSYNKENVDWDLLMKESMKEYPVCSGIFHQLILI